MAHAALNTVRERIAAAAERSGRHPGSVTLVAVSKGQSLASIRSAYEEGHRDFGENRADELAGKAPHLPEDIRWHFVGTLQSRKAGTVRPVVSLLHSLDRPSLVAAWSKGGDHPPPALVQVDLAAEPRKHGVAPGEVRGLLAAATSAGIGCTGLMIIPPLPADPEDSRPWFRGLAALRSDLEGEYPTLVELSMGMTDDFEVAVEEGASLIRVGRAIFGPRT